MMSFVEAFAFSKLVWNALLNGLPSFLLSNFYPSVIKSFGGFSDGNVGI